LERGKLLSEPGQSGATAVGVSFVMPCLNEILSLAACIAAIREAEAQIAAQ